MKAQMGSLSQCFGFCHSNHATSSSRSGQPSLIEEVYRRFSLSQIQQSTNNFNQTQIIARGFFVGVYKGSLEIDGTDYTVAIKRLSSQFKSSSRLSQLRNEIQLLCQLRHPNLVTLIGFCDDKGEMILVYEYMANQSLSNHLYSPNNIKPLCWKERLEICIGAARGLHYLHTGAKRSILHCHVKPRNILLDENLVPKLADFGFSLKVPASPSKAKELVIDTIVGTYAYMAPEYAMFGMITEKCDVYSFGITLVEVICAKRADMINIKMDEIANKDEGDESDDYLQKEEYNLTCLARRVYDFVHNGEADKVIDPFLVGKIGPECWELYVDIARRCLLEEPNDRPAMGEVELELERALELQEKADIKYR